jgi:hypothetical protein
MKKLFIVSLVILHIALALLYGGEAIAGTYTTNFPATENPISEGGVWIGPAASWTPVATSTGFAHGTQPGSSYYSDSYAILSGFGNDHQVDVVIRKNSTEGEVEALLRFSKNGNNTYGYECLMSIDGGMQIASWDGPVGTYHLLTTGRTPNTPATGDTLRAKIIGNRVTVSFIRSGVETVCIDFTDTNNLHPTGQPGMGFFVTSGGSNTSFGVSSFTATDVVSGGGDSTSPTISLSSPANNATVSGTVSVTATASDNVGVTKVEFFVNGTL